MKVPARIYADEDLLAKMRTDRTIQQCVNVTHLTGIYKYAITMPDGHEGYGFPIGGVAATDYDEGLISPGGVGYDINCGVRLIRTNLSEDEVRPGSDRNAANECARRPGNSSRHRTLGHERRPGQVGTLADRLCELRENLRDPLRLS